MKRIPDRWRGVTSATGAAALFGATTPFAKELLPNFDPWLMAGLLYLGSGLGLSVVRIAGRLWTGIRATPLSCIDVPGWRQP